MEKAKNGKKHIGLVALLLCNLALIVSAVLFTVNYSANIQKQKEVVQRQTFCNNVDAMRQISERYLETELASVKSWRSYIELEDMTMDEALAYISTIEDKNSGEAHIIDMDTYAAVSTNYVNGVNTVERYRHSSTLDDTYTAAWLGTLQKMFDGEKVVLSRFNIVESGRNCIGVGTRVNLREADGSHKDYLLLRAILISRMRELWVFPTTFPNGEIGMITVNADYVVPSKSMKSENFMEFVRYYNFREDYYGADELLAQLKTQDQGLLELYNSKKPKQLCYWYYSRLENFDDVDILGYVPVEDLQAGVDSLSIVLVVAGLTLLLGILDGVYIFSINRRLRVVAREAERANMSKTQFLSTMSHDIRTPLNAVIGMTELAQSRIDDTAYVKECLGKISISGGHLLTLINDILEISRVESGKTMLNPMPFDVKALVGSLESITRSQAVGHGLDFTVDMGELPYPTLLGDKLRLTQVYLNLLNNAVKYTNPGGHVYLRVREGVPDADGLVPLICVVEDNGVGMTPEFQNTMYESFTRVADSRTDKIQGTGLGLAIVKRMVDLMDGSIECESTVGAGTIFTVRISLAIADGADVQKSAAHSDAAAGNDLRGLSVLIAEDNDLNWEIISAMLGDYGVSCTRAENGRVCVDKLLSAAPGAYALVLMDIQMPVMNGLDAARALRTCNRADLRELPIVAMTADAFAEDVQRCMEAGMNAHVSKPIEIEKVLVTIRRLLTNQNSTDDTNM